MTDDCTSRSAEHIYCSTGMCVLPPWPLPHVDIYLPPQGFAGCMGNYWEADPRKNLEGGLGTPRHEARPLEFQNIKISSLHA